jgi:hypothetical protein
MNDLLYKRGDLSPCGTKRFWNYQKYISKKTGKRTEVWVPIERYDAHKKRAYDYHALYMAQREWGQQQRSKLKTK